ncbi:hypothetical protein M427DRAFT_55385 [Gonapodya prolifera JEL478]|uniref:Uncharacterized protein n=1 Tax=Gonapodya prolifera (strain JEL478) TaxID=1344416 RepID=A0A139AIX9_GONPJ|nr:hypothetical protein M427DRAFT_55385 [Gonapodya prolifera JEL478]|eukprot:KXS16413.1 hypothetical protein M427DRAFT_55385 [Gonapodya prolifera JEL478]
MPGFFSSLSSLASLVYSASSSTPRTPAAPPPDEVPSNAMVHKRGIRNASARLVSTLSKFGGGQKRKVSPQPDPKGAKPMGAAVVAEPEWVEKWREFEDGWAKGDHALPQFEPEVSQEKEEGGGWGDDVMASLGHIAVV